MNATIQKLILLVLGSLILVAGQQGCLHAEESRAELLASLKSGKDRGQLSAIKRLIKEGTFDVELARALAVALKDTSSDVRRAAALGLERIGAPAKETVPALLELVKDKDSSVRSAVIAALGVLGPPEKEVLPALVEALKDPIPQLRVAAVEAIRRYGPGLKDSAEARAALSELGQREKHADVINALVVCLVEVDPVSVELAPFFVAGLRGGAAARLKSVEALNKIGPAAAPALLPSLSSDNILVRREIAAMFDAFLKNKDAPASIRSPEVALALAAALKDADGTMRKHTVAALSSMGRDALPAAPELLKRLSENDYLVRVSAAGVFENLGVPVPEAVPPLLELLQDKYSAARSAAGRALAKQGGEAALNGALALLKSPRDEVRHSAIIALGLFGPAAEPGLALALKSERPEEQLAALSALDRIGGARAEALPELIKLLKSPSSSTRLADMTLLSKSGANAVPSMMTALTSIDRLGTISQPNDFQTAVEDAFGKIGAPAVPALMAFVREKTDDPARVPHRVAAMNALGKIGAAANPAVGMLIAELEPVPSLTAPAAPVITKKSAVATPAALPAVPSRAREDAAALFALGGIGRASEAALPLMFEMLKDGESVVRLEAGRSIAKIATGKERIPPLTEIVERCDSTALSFALRPFQDDGLRALLAEFEPTNLSTRQRISSAFSSVPGPSAIQFLTEELKQSTELKMRVGAAFILGEMRHLKRSSTPTSTSTALDAALPVLKAAINDPDPDVSVLAAYACGRNTDPDDTALIAKIANGLARCQADNRSRGMIALAYYNLEKHGRMAAPALGVLVRSVASESSSTGTAKSMLHLIGHSKEDVPVLVELLKDKSSYTRRLALKLLEAMGPDAVAASPVLIEGLNEEDKNSQKSYESVLLAIGSEAVPHLIEAIKNTPPLEGKAAAKQLRRSSAAQVLTQMKLDGEWLQRIADLLLENRAEVRAGAMMVLSAGAERAKYALPHLKQLLADDDKLVSRVGIELVSLMGADAVPELVALAKDPRPNIRTRVAYGLRPIGGATPTPEAIAALLGLLKDDTSEVKAAALTTLATIKGNDAEIIKELPAALRDENALTRKAAVTYLKAHGASAPKETIGCLAFVMKDKNADSKLKLAAIEALHELSPNDLALSTTVALPVQDPVNEVKNPNAPVDPAQFELPKAPNELPPADAEAVAKKQDGTKDVVVSIESLLFGALDDADRKVRSGAAEAVTKFGLDADPAKKVLINQMFAFDALELYAHAQEEYFIKAWDDQRVHYYAAALQDLPTLPSSLIAAEMLAPGEPQEVANPAKPKQVPAPYKGYWFKLLESQGANAVGGAKKFIIEGRYSQGHALAAIPEEYGKTGKCVFIVGDDGTIYKKDLGPETVAMCANLRELNPDATWEKSKVRPKEDQTIRFHTPDPDSVPLEF